MNMPLIIKQVCQQLGLMEVMQKGSGPGRGPLGSGRGLREPGWLGPGGGGGGPRALAPAWEIQ